MARKQLKTEKMSLELKPGWDIDSLVSRLERQRILTDDGKVSFRGGIFMSDTAVLESAIAFHKSLPELERLKIASGAVFEAGKKELSRESILAEAGRRQKEFLKKPLQIYVLCAEISILPFVTARTIETSRIRLYPARPKKFEAGSIETRIKNYVITTRPTDYASVLVTTRGRSVADAHETAINALDVLRGIWNLALNRRSDWRISNELPRPVNRVLLGPIQTLHLPSGKLADDNFWYDPGFIGPLPRVHLSQAEASAVIKFEKALRAQIRRLNDRARVADFIVRYCRSLDGRDLQTCFVNLWTLLETLTGTEAGQGYNVTIERAARHFRDPEPQLPVLRHLRDQRNGIVHRHQRPHQMEQLVFRLKGYVESLLMASIANRFRFKSVSEFQEFLQLPLDAKLVAKRAELYRKAHRWATAKP